MASSTRIFGNRCRALMAAAKTAAASNATAAASAATAAASAATAAAKPKVVNRNTGILKVHMVSPALAKFIGSPETSRSGAVKKIWEYVKSHNLQNSANKREIYCDDKLKTIFDGKDKVNFQEVAKLLSNHFPKTT